MHTRQDAVPSTFFSNTMFEYIFFNAALRDQFIQYVEQRGVACAVSDDPLGLVVEIPEDLPDDVFEDLERYHDMLENEQAKLSRKEGDLKSLASFRFKLPDGQSRMLPMQTEMANRLLGSFSLAEIQGLFEDVARCTLNPSEERLCKIIDAQDKSA